MQNNKAGCLRQFNKELYNAYQNKIRLSQVFSDVDGEVLKTEYYNDATYVNPADYSWISDFMSAVNRIRTVAAAPRMHIRTERESRRAESASKVDAAGMQLTFKDGKYWKKKDGKFEPEYVYASVGEDDIAIYENRFLAYVADSIYSFVSRQISQIYDKISRLDTLVVNNAFNLGDIDGIGKCAPFYRHIENREQKEVTVEMVGSDERIPLLTTGKSDTVVILKKLLRLKQKTVQLFESELYKVCKRVGKFEGSNIQTTNLLLQDPDYSACYFFYMKYLAKEKRKKTSFVTKKYYENFVLMNILIALHNMGFVQKRKYESVSVDEKGRYVFNGVKMLKEPMLVSITSVAQNTVVLEVELKFPLNKFIKDIDLAERRRLKVIVELYPNIKRKKPTPQQMNEFFDEIIEKRIAEGYDNCYVISTIDGLKNNNVIMCSPDRYKIDSNIENFLKSLMLFVEGDSFVYTRRCPVCGSIGVSYSDGNYHCENCNSLYSLLRSGKEDERREMIWIKRIKKTDDEE